jgi:hypothetical protein
MPNPETPNETPKPAPDITKIPESFTKNPEEVKKQIKSLTVDKLDALSKNIIDAGKQTNDELIASIRERSEELEKAETVDQRLASLQSRLNLVKLLESKPPQEYSRVDNYVAGPLRWLAEKTEKVPALGFLTGFLKNLKGSDIERVMYKMLTGAGKLSMGVPAFLQPILPVDALGRYGERKIAELDIKDTIRRVGLPGEKIAFKDIPATAWDALVKERTDSKQPMPVIAKLTEELITNLRADAKKKGTSVDATITLTDILAPDKVKRDAESKELAELWKPLEMTKVDIVKDDQPIKIDRKNKTASIHSKADITPSLIAIVTNAPPSDRATVISFMPKAGSTLALDKPRAKCQAGVLTLNANDTLASVLATLKPDDMAEGKTYVFTGGNWTVEA